ncbi:hypothetical protein JCM10908_003850 [Rhodotorula pacifica]|uniref:uncharacterized protein n=1 Tax=Rhodotorula pacifica TaxID=1495444 RepID=UPI003176C30C
MLLGAQLYRSLLKEARALPDPGLCQHYKDHIRHLFHREDVPESSLQAVRRVKRAQKLLRQLQAANDGYLHALTRTFEHAYGVRGKGKHAALQPFLDLGLQDRKTRHSFPPPLAALVTSSISHTARAPSPAQLVNPPTLPARADPTSEDARLLGPLIPQRIKAIKRRYWNSQTGKIRAPIAVRLHADGREIHDVAQAAELLERYAKLDISPHALAQGRDRLAELVEKATAPTAWRGLPPRRLQTAEQRALRGSTASTSAAPARAPPELRVLKPSSANTKWHLPKSMTARLLHRRMQETLTQAPIVDVKVTSPRKEGEAVAVKYDVTRHEAAKGEKGRYRLQTPEERWWQEQAKTVTSSSAATKKPKKGKAQA